MPSREDRIKQLFELTSAYLYKDVLELGGIRNPRKLRDLLRLLAYQVGSEVSYQELGRQTGMSADTVVSYIDLLEKAFVVFRVGGFSRNLRKEITKKYNSYRGFYGGSWFWRTHTGAEVDYVEDCDGQLDGFEFKLREEEAKQPASWASTYPEATFGTIHPGNYLGFVASAR
jgi:uncharacterized protein